MNFGASTVEKTAVERSQPLAGLRVLLFHPDYFDLGSCVAEALGRQGAAVHAVSTRPDLSFGGRACLRLIPSTIEPWITQRLWKTVERTRFSGFDVLLAIGGEGLSEHLVRDLRRMFPSMRTGLYLWDSVANHPTHERRAAAFHRTFSFDRVDCLRHPAWSHMPLFAPAAFWSPANSANSPNGTTLVATFHPERMRVLRRWIRRSNMLGLQGHYAVLGRGWVDRIRWPGMRDRRLGVQRLLRPLRHDEIVQRFESATCVLDIHHTGQSGLTLRTFEALAMGRRLVTTNTEVRSYDFFDPRIIQVIDRRNPQPDPEFIAAGLAPPHFRLASEYHVDAWGRRLIGAVV